jgi:F0F1-type ATP synthase assembly protein I
MFMLYQSLCEKRKSTFQKLEVLKMIPRIVVIVYKLTVAQLIKFFPEFYGTLSSLPCLQYSNLV